MKKIKIDEFRILEIDSKYFNIFDKTNEKYYNFISFVKEVIYGKNDNKGI